MLSVNKYDFQSWKEKFPEKVALNELNILTNWNEYIQKLHSTGIFDNIEKTIQEEIENDKNVFPYPDLVFNVFNQMNIEDIRVVILGQDPYHTAQVINGKLIPHAMGVSFSVPIGAKIPSSLENIYKSQIENKHFYKYPEHGNLEFWCNQGCFMLNTSLTVQQGTPNSHEMVWKNITDQIIHYISDTLDNVVFVLWGNNALSKLKLIDQDKHYVIISSHPSGYSVSSPLKDYPPFSKLDHFGEINKYLKKHNRRQIIWQIL